MSRKIIVDANFPNETRVVLLDSSGQIEEIEYETAHKQQNKGNIYLAKITRVEPSLQAVFIEYGNEKKGFLPFIEIDQDYYEGTIHKKSLLQHLQEITLSEFSNEELASNIASELKEGEEIANDPSADDKSKFEMELDTLETDIETISPTNPPQIKVERIANLLKTGQVLLVQLTKEERGNKGASFTTFISLAGKYCVLMPNKALQTGVSRKISQVNERKRLKNIITNLSTYTNKTSASIIARTAAMGHSLLDLKKDYDYLARLWNSILSCAQKTSAPNFIHQEDGIIQKIIRDMFNRHVTELLIQGSIAYQKAIKFTKDISPVKLNKVIEYKNKVPIFTRYNIEEQLIKLYQPIINLISGGYIVINPTEALISIDVNSGRSTSERTIEETAVKTNLEAAKEIAKQIKLRDLSGLLVIDFIDMQDTKNKKHIEKAFKEFLSRDRAKIQIGNISSFGLLEMSRQRMRPSFLEANSSICLHCNGKGVVRVDESNAMLILRTIENEIFDSVNNELDTLNVYASTGAVIYLLNNKREEISYIEEKYKIRLNFFNDFASTSDSYSLEKIKSNKKLQQILPLINAETEVLPEALIIPPAKNKPVRKKWKSQTSAPAPVDDTANSTSSPSTPTLSKPVANSPRLEEIENQINAEKQPILISQVTDINPDNNLINQPPNAASTIINPAATVSKRKHIKKRMHRKRVNKTPTLEKETSERKVL